MNEQTAYDLSHPKELENLVTDAIIMLEYSENQTDIDRWQRTLRVLEARSRMCSYYWQEKEMTAPGAWARKTSRKQYANWLVLAQRAGVYAK